MPDSCADLTCATAAVEESLPAYLASLDRGQRLAVLHGGSATAAPAEPLLVIAGAGSGKTKTLAARVAHLVRLGSDARRILLLTFSRRAAAEMERRVGALLHRAFEDPAGSAMRDAPSLPWSGTFHGIGARLLREYAPRIGLADSFSILDRSDAEDLMALCRHELGLSQTRNRFPGKGTCIAIYSRTVNAEAELAATLRSAFPWCEDRAIELQRLFAAYVEAKQTQQVLDYDDLLLWWAQMMAETTLAREIGERFDHVLVDEYQDTNRLQASILRGLKPDGRGVTVVGDDAQSIYAFRAATIRNILDFPGQYRPPARVITLDRNYRSTQPILDASNAVIRLAAERYAKDLWTDRASAERPRLVTVRDEAEAARYVADDVLAQREQGTPLRSQAVLFRTSNHSAPLELELLRRDIPFVKFGGLRFLEAAHVKDVLSVLRFADNPRHRVAAFRALRLLPGVGAASAHRLIDQVRDSADAAAALEACVPRGAFAGAWRPFVALFRAVHAGAPSWPAEVDRVVRWYEPELPRLHDDAPARLADLEQLVQIATTYPSRERFLSELALDPPEASSKEAAHPSRDEDYLILSTIHSAKGQEWKSVHVLNVVDGCIPSDLATRTTDEIEEERRLLYVAMTRAKDRLTLLVPQRFFVHGQSSLGDRHVHASRSRFLPDGIGDQFEVQAWPTPVEAPPRVAPGPAVDLGARVRARWSG